MIYNKYQYGDKILIQSPDNQIENEYFSRIIFQLTSEENPDWEVFAYIAGNKNLYYISETNSIGLYPNEEEEVNIYKIKLFLYGNIYPNWFLEKEISYETEPLFISFDDYLEINYNNTIYQMKPSFLWSNSSICIDGINNDNYYYDINAEDAIHPIALDDLYIYHELIDTEDDVAMFESFSGIIAYNYICDNIITQNQLLNSWYKWALATGEENNFLLDWTFGYETLQSNRVHRIRDFMYLTSPEDLFPMVISCPYDNYTTSYEGMNINIPRKGIYILNNSSFRFLYAVDDDILLKFRLAFDISDPTEILYNNEINNNNLILAKNVKQGDILYIKYKKTISGITEEKIYINKLYSIKGSELLYAGPYRDSNGDGVLDTPDYNSQFFTLEINPNTREVELKTLVPNESWIHIYIIKYMEGKIARNIQVEFENNELLLASSTRISSLTDNAGNETSSYNYSVDNNNLLTLTSTQLIITNNQAGTANLIVFSDETDNYQAGTFYFPILIKNSISNELNIFFDKDDWETRFQDFYQVSHGTNPFYDSSSPFAYEGIDSLRSAQIGNNGTSETTINFRLTQPGTISFSYKISSQSNYDYFWVYIDGVQKLKVSGQTSTPNSNWINSSIFELSAANHNITFKYTKNSSTSRGYDCAAIGFIKITGIVPIKYLMRSEGKFYGFNSSNERIELNENEMTADLFKTYGINTVPISNQIIGLIDPEILCWNASEVPLKTLKAVVKGSPTTPYMMVSKEYEILNGGIKSVKIKSSDQVVFVFSFDGGKTWKFYYKSDVQINWGTATEDFIGMSKDTVNSITKEVWDLAIANNPKTIMVKFYLQNLDDYVQEIVIEYLDKEE